MLTTKKNQTVIGKQEYINPETGELELFNVVSQKSGDFNFEKIWIGHLLEALNVLGNKKVLVLQWMLKNKDNKNQIIGTHRGIAEDCKVSLPVVTETFKLLMEINAIKKVQNGVYLLNPEIVFKGSGEQRMNILLRYEKTN